VGTSDSSTQCLSWRTLASYGFPGLPLAALGLPMYVYLPTFYARDLALGVGLVGVILLGVRLFDLLTDPLAGWISDRLPWRRHRRRVSMAVGAPVLLAGVWMLFHPPESVGVLWLLSGLMIAYLGWTFVMVPYTAWGAELSPEYHERSRLSASREGFMALGTLVALGVPALLGLADNPAATLSLMAWLMLILLPIALLIAMTGLPEPITRPKPGLGERPHWRIGMRILLDNAPLRRLMLIYLLNGLANGLPATLFLLYVRERLQTPEAIGPLLLLYFAAGILSLPAWTALSRHIGKHRAWAISITLACAGFLPVAWLGPGDLWWFVAVVAITGLSVGADLALPAAIQADIVDLDTAAGGNGRAGLLFGLWGMATKLAMALAVGIGFPLLGLFGYDASATTQPESALTALTLLYGVLPLLIKLPCSWYAWHFPLDEATHQRLRAEHISEVTS